MFKGKNVLITGASKGLGSQIAKDFAKNGAKVIINYNKSYEKALNLKEEIDKNYEKCLIIKADVSIEKEVIEMIEKIKQEVGHVDILINNAGISKDNLIEFKNENEFKEVLETNLLGTYLVSKHIKNILNNNSSIINISSDNALYPETYSIDYDASKAGIISLTHSFAKEYSPKTRVNCILPGWIKTDMNKDLDENQIKQINNKCLLKRFAEKEEISNVVLFLASDKASYINSTNLVINGGRND